MGPGAPKIWRDAIIKSFLWFIKTYVLFLFSLSHQQVIGEGGKNLGFQGGQIMQAVDREECIGGEWIT